MKKEKMITKSMKYRIKFDKYVYDILKEIQYKTYLIKNKTTTMIYDWQQFSFSYNTRYGEYPKEKELLGKTVTNDIYNQLKDMGEYLASSTYNTAIKEAVDKFNQERSDILKGEIPLSRYKRDGSFPIRATQIKDLAKINHKTFSVKLSLLSNIAVKEMRKKLEEENKEREKEGKETIMCPKDIKTQIEVILMSGRGATEILDRIIDGEYKLCDSRITKDKKNRFYLSIAYQLPQKSKELNKNKVMGIDIGVNIPAMLAISNDNYYKQEVGDGREILKFQTQMKERYRRLQKSRKWAGDGSRGHGRKTLMKPLNNLSGKIANFKDYKNHVWSRYIIEEAIRNECGVIQMEKLEGIASDSAFLKNWTYYDLQQKIKYKAEEVGIEVKFIDPKYTSQRCSCCGFIHKQNRDIKKSQEKFECVKCGFKANADWNAAKNISIPNIENLIKQELERQEKEQRNLQYVI